MIHSYKTIILTFNQKDIIEYLGFQCILVWTVTISFLKMQQQEQQQPHAKGIPKGLNFYFPKQIYLKETEYLPGLSGGKIVKYLTEVTVKATPWWITLLQVSTCCTDTLFIFV